MFHALFEWRTPVSLSPQQRLLAEQIRVLEESQEQAYSASVPSTGLNFLSWLGQRNAQLHQRSDLQLPLQHAEKMYHRFLWGIALLACIAGALTSIKALSNAGTELNIFWALGVLLGLSWLSLLLWLLALLFQRSQPGLLAPLFSKALERIFPMKKKPSPTQAVDRVWLAHHFLSASGPMRLGWLTHFAWSSYLFGGVLGLLLLFTTRQFNFVWESTLLGGDSFVTLVQWLSPPLDAIGIRVPNAQEISASGRDFQVSDPADVRKLWAIFIMGCVLVYGLLPRLLLMVLCRVWEWRVQQRDVLNLNQPYYIRLQREFWPKGSEAKVVDHDWYQDEAGKTSGSKPMNLPSEGYWVGLELAMPLALPPQIQQTEALINIVDEASMQLACQQLKGLKQPIFLLVDGRKSADRGLQRIVLHLVEQVGREQFWIRPYPTPTEAKRQSWLQVAARAGLTPEQVRSL